MEKKILIVGDSKEYIQNVVRFIIEDSVTYALLSAFNGADAVEIASKENPDVIVMSWVLLDISGIDATVLLKNNKLTKYIPVFISSDVNFLPSDVKIAFDAGASDFIRFPFEKIEFMARLVSLINNSLCLKSIMVKRELSAYDEIGVLKGKIDCLQSKLNNDLALFDFFNDALISLQRRLEGIDVLDDKDKRVILKITGQVKQSIISFKRKCNDFNKPGSIFTQKLLSKHNNLTHQEIKLCFMLKNNLCTKDIAMLTFREESSVKVSRSRLRRKLKLKESDSLLAYIDNF